MKKAHCKLRWAFLICLVHQTVQDDLTEAQEELRELKATAHIQLVED